MANRPLIEAHGLNEFRRAVRQADKVIGKELQADLKKVAVDVAAAAGALAPRATGKMAAAYRGGAAGTNAKVRNPVFYSRFQEFDTRRSNGHVVEGRHPIGRAVEQMEDKIIDGVGDAIESAAVKLGWH